MDGGRCAVLVDDGRCAVRWVVMSCRRTLMPLCWSVYVLQERFFNSFGGTANRQR